VRALTEWLTRHRFETDLECLFQAAGGGEASAECIERMQTELTIVLALDHHPIVVPVRKEVAGEKRGIYRQEVR